MKRDVERKGDVDVEGERSGCGWRGELSDGWWMVNSSGG
jgi:hypothetical protein